MGDVGLTKVAWRAGRSLCGWVWLGRSGRYTRTGVLDGFIMANVLTERQKSGQRRGNAVWGQQGARSFEGTGRSRCAADLCDSEPSALQ